MTDRIPTWAERCADHPDHKGIVSDRMIFERMQEEINDLRAALAKPVIEVYQLSMAESGSAGAWIDVDIDAWQSAAAYPEYKRRVVVEVHHD